eukprot:GILI01026782.1.p2 GENE.GILI01026782.1~~GILI01026782.1.p2  ORF type:complete len:164 (-),score=32.96 GILI01026782.1:35-526(-)
MEDFEMMRDALLSEMKQKIPNWKDIADTPLLDRLSAFFHAIDWQQDRWLFAVIIFQITLFFFAHFTRRIWSAQVGLLLGILASAGLSQHLNNFLSANWASFSSQNYFDKNGSFIFCFYAGPLLFTALCVVINSVIQTSEMLVKVKRAELQQARRGKDESKKSQ